MSEPDLFTVSRNLVRLGRNADYREQFNVPCEEAPGGVKFLLDDLERHWAQRFDLRREHLQHAIQKFMYHENEEEMRFQLFESSQGLTVFVASSRHAGKGKSKGKSKGKGKFSFSNFRDRSRSPGPFHGAASSRGRRDNRENRGRRAPRVIRRRSRSGSRRRRSRSPGGVGEKAAGSLVEDVPENLVRPPPPIQGQGGDQWEMFCRDDGGGLWYDHPGYGEGYRWACFEEDGKLGKIQAYKPGE